MDADAVVTHVGLVPKRRVRLDRVHALVLKAVGFDFFRQPDSATLLRKINQHTTSLLRDCLKGNMKLIPAIATQRINKVTGEAAAVHADQRSLTRMVGGVTHHNRDRLLSLELNLIGKDPEIAVLGRQIRFRDARNQFFGDASVSDEVFDGDEF